MWGCGSWGRGSYLSILMLVSLIDSWLSLSADFVFIVSWFSDIDNTCQLINLLFTVVDYPMFNV